MNCKQRLKLLKIWDENSSIKFVSYYSCYFNKYFGIAANSSNSERNMSDKISCISCIFFRSDRTSSCSFCLPACLSVILI